MKRRRRGTRRRVFTFSLQAGEGKKRKLRKLRQKPRRYQKAAYGNPRYGVEVVTLPVQVLDLPNLPVCTCPVPVAYLGLVRVLYW